MGLIRDVILSGGGDHPISKLSTARERRHQRHDNKRRGSISRDRSDAYLPRNPVDAYPSHGRVNAYPTHGQAELYPSNAQMDYSQQGGYGPPPYRQYQESREQRYTGEYDTQEQDYSYSSNNYIDSRIPHQYTTGAGQVGTSDGRWPPQDDESLSMSDQRQLMDSNPPYYSSRQPRYMSPSDEDSFEERRGRDSSSVIGALVKMASDVLSKRR